jgi:RNA polymerase sigma-70 factor (ECF subfamily)
VRRDRFAGKPLGIRGDAAKVSQKQLLRCYKGLDVTIDVMHDLHCTEPVPNQPLGAFLAISAAKFSAPPPQTSQTLTTLVERVAQHDREAFASLYQATSLKLFGIALRILKRRSWAEDVLQDVYIKVWERAADFDPSKGAVISWMATITRNRSLDEIRRGAHVVSSEDVGGVEDIASLEPLASETMERSEEHQRLTRCLNGIEEEKRKMVLLAYHYGTSREKLAEQFGRPVATIKTWLRRSLESLKECLST